MNFGDIKNFLTSKKGSDNDLDRNVSCDTIVRDVYYVP